VTGPGQAALDRRGSATVTEVAAIDGTERPDRADPPLRGGCTTSDGVGIATYDFGGEGPDLLLVHATGFCATVLTPLAAALAADYHCWGLDLRYHGHSDRPADGSYAWSGFATDVLTVVDHLGLDHPFGVGHSCGGASLLLAEQRRPGTFRALYGFEPVVLPADPIPATFENNVLSKGALRRRQTFPSRTDAFLNFTSKPPFNVLDPDALQAYVIDGFELVPSEEGGDGEAIRLRCRREDEAQVYAHGPSHDAWVHLDEVGCPVALVCGAETDAFGPRLLRAVAGRLPVASVDVLPGIGHFGPLERPDLVADSVRGALDGPPVTTPS
jgi:pimeloyl-ACP methyl ester carboxylesterase